MTEPAELPDTLRVDLVRWSDALQRYIDVPAYALYFMACLAHEVDSTIDRDAMTPELRAWLFRVEEVVVQVMGVGSWDEAVRELRIPEYGPRSLEAWANSDSAPPVFRELLATKPSQPEDP